MKYLLFVLAFLFANPACAQDAAVPTSREQITLSFSPVVKKVAPAVVNIYTRRTVNGASMMNPFMDDPFFSQFFEGVGPMRKRVEQSLGSGFIIDPSGLIVTNVHVVKDAEEVMAVLSDGREFAAKTVLVDGPSDIALLRIDVKGASLPVAALSPSEKLEVGDLVLAIGNPFGVGQTVTSGIVSALARSNTDIDDFDFFIQTDAAINPGNSGGPLVAMDGSVVGVNSAIYSKSGGSLGIGFAIPSEMIQAVVAAEKSGHVSSHGVVRPWLGFAAQTMTADIATSLGFDRPHGALVSDVTTDGPGDKAGLLRGDVITAINDRAIADADELKFRIATIPIGDTARLRIRRNNEDKVLDFTASPPAEIPPRNPVTVDGNNPLQGATIVNVSPAVVYEMALKNQIDGVVVQSVSKGSIADRMGLETGDGILAIGEREVTDTTRLKSMLAAKPDAKKGWAFTIRRQGRDQAIILR